MKEVAIEFFQFTILTEKDRKYLLRQRGTAMFYVLDQDEEDNTEDEEDTQNEDQ